MQESITRNVVFHETIFPYSHLTPSTFPHTQSTTPQNLTSQTLTELEPNSDSSPPPKTTQPAPIITTRTGRQVVPPSHLTDYLCNSVSSATPYPIS